MSTGNSCSQLHDNTSEKRKAMVCEPRHFHTARQHVTEYAKQKFDLKPDDDILDFGCGVLRIGLPLIEYLDSKRFYGYDVSEDRIAEARKEVDDYNLGYKMPTLTSDWSQINKQFKHIWSYQVLIHVPDDELFKVIDRIKQALADDGVALVSVNTDTKQFPKDLRWREYPFVVRPLDFYKEAFDRVDLDFEMHPKWKPDSGERILKVWHN